MNQLLGKWQSLDDNSKMKEEKLQFPFFVFLWCFLMLALLAECIFLTPLYGLYKNLSKVGIMMI